MTNTTSTDLCIKDIRISKGSRGYELLTSGKPEDRKKAEKLTEYCGEARKGGYNFEKLTQLREKYKEIA